MKMSRRKEDTQIGITIFVYVLMLTANVLDRQIELQLNNRKIQIADFNSRQDFTNWVFCLCQKCHSGTTDLLRRLDLISVSTAYLHKNKNPSDSTRDGNAFVPYDQYCALYRQFLSGTVSETGQPITQPVAVQQQGAAAAAHPAFEDNYAYGHYQVADDHQDYEMHSDHGSHMHSDHDSHMHTDHDSHSQAATQDSDLSDGHMSEGSGSPDEVQGLQESSQPPATYGARTGMLGRWATWWYGGYTEEDTSRDPPETLHFEGPVNRPSAHELRGRLPGNDGAKTVNADLEEAQGNPAQLIGRAFFITLMGCSCCKNLLHCS
jgi:hypothetical protein